MPADVAIALVGNPNCGKTALFNRLTGSRQKVANYAGATVERKEGRLRTPSGRSVRVLDLPGAYSLDAKSPDEAITRAVCRGELAGEARPDALVCVLDATNLRAHLRFALEALALGLPTIVALNLSDDARRRGIRIDRAALEAALGVPVVETIAIRRDGAQALIERLDGAPLPAPPRHCALGRADLHAQAAALFDAAVTVPHETRAVDDAIDRVALHPVAGLALLAATLFLMFQAVYAWARPVMDLITAGVEAAAALVDAALPAGPLKSLLTDGVLAGAGSVLVFLPQILILFAFILALEQSGYLPRAAFLLDTLMRRAGLSGRAFIPLLSSFACAVPGIMATRTIQHPGERIATMLVAPLMTCSARLPVYALLIAAFIPDRAVAGGFNLQGLTLFGLYVAGIAAGVAVAFVLKRLHAGGDEQPLLLELPAYRWPSPTGLALGLLERAKIFLRRVGTIIFALTVLLWLLASWPLPPPDATQPPIYYSAAGLIGRALSVVLEPLGFNWQIGIALVPGLAAREVAVAALGSVYALSAAKDEAAAQLLPIIAAQWPLGTGLALLAWYVFAPQCISTLVALRRESGSARLVVAATAAYFALAWLAAFVTYQFARPTG